MTGRTGNGRPGVGRRGAIAGSAAATLLASPLLTRLGNAAMPSSDLLIVNARITTLDRANPQADAVAIRDGRFLAVGREAEVRTAASPDAAVIDAKGRRLIPGLIDSHIHVIRGGLNYNMELRWDGVPTLADAMAMLRAQVARTPAPQWVRVVGGFTEHQFAEKRLPTLEELNAAAPDHAGLHPAPLRPRASERRCAAGGGIRQGHAQPTGRRDPARRRGQPDRPAARPAQRDDPVLHPRQGAEAARGVSGQLHPPFHAGAEQSGRHQRDRRRRRLPELSRRLRDHREAARRRRDDPAHRLQPVHPEAEGGVAGLRHLVRQGQAGRRRRPLPPERGGGDAGLFGGRLRGLPRRPARDAAQHGDGPGAGGSPAGRAALAVAAARHLRRDHRPGARRLREGQPRHPVAGAELVLRPRRNDQRAQHRPHRRARRRHRRAAPHGLSGRVFRGALRRQGRRGHAAHREDDGRRGAGGRRDGRHPCRQLQPLGLAVLAGHR
ncbi:protein of unknown function (plasmid) [Azospirillum baldaniorum]|uniref:Amidohydrolase 3 domain-containing protein n=1 Tax=Azospirillum baldaniorum TaxID=1064539 RepID=A0A9P1JUY8_9PROT|nr:protein of unknown function [Azospirillum baldaniorum]